MLIELPRFDRRQDVISKRIVLSTVTNAIDTMALISQVLVALMVFVRELWIQQTDWDQILTPLIQQRVTRPLLESGTIRYFEVPR